MFPISGRTPPDLSPVQAKSRFERGICNRIDGSIAVFRRLSAHNERVGGMNARGLTRTLAAAATALAVGLALAPTASAGWSKPFAVAAPKLGGGSPALATSPRHGAVVAWLDGRTEKVRARRIGANGRLGRVRLLGPINTYVVAGPWVAVSRSGAGVVVWDRGGSLVARKIGMRGKLGPTRELGPTSDSTESSDARVAIDAAGNATIVWARVLVEPVEPKGVRVLSSAVQVRRLGADGSLGPVHELPAGGAYLPMPRVAAAPSGAAAVIWTWQGEGAQIVRAATIGKRGAIGPVRDVSAPRPFWSGEESADVAMGPGGTATIAWLTSGSISAVAARRMAPDGELGEILTVAGEQYSNSQPRVAVDGAGGATVVWRYSGPPTGSSGLTDYVQARQIRAGGTLGSLHNLSAASLEVGVPEVAGHPAGGATATWARRFTADARPVYAIQGRQIGRRGRLGAIKTLSRKRPAYFTRAPVIADARGAETAIWSWWPWNGAQRVAGVRHD
jgi:hypothetical protein